MYDHSKIMKTAWSDYRLWSLVYKNYSFAQSLRKAWSFAKREAEQEAQRDRSHYEVVGMKLWNGSERVIATGIDHDTAARIKWENRCQYDVVEIRKVA